LPKRDKPTKVDTPPPVQRGAGLLGLRKLVSTMAGARLCYGEPVRAGERIVIPVARVQAGGGGGWGTGFDPKGGNHGEGGGGGGGLEAAPVGFIDIGPEGARFEAIPDPMTSARALRTGATGLTTLAAAFAGYRALRRQRRLGGALSGGRRRLLSR
jgi:hypothetical protein